MDWMQKLIVRKDLETAPQAGVSHNPMREIADQLLEAAARFDARRDNFAAGKGNTCRDIAEKILHFGSFASEKQQGFALKLIEWSKPRNQDPRVSAGEVRAAVARPAYPQTFALMQKFADVYVGDLKLARKNQDTLVWVLWNDKCVGKMESPDAILWPRKLDAAGVLEPRVRERLAELEASPVEVLQKYGRASGRCGCCGRDLTDPESIAFGIGPVCRNKL